MCDLRKRISAVGHRLRRRDPTRDTRNPALFLTLFRTSKPSPLSEQAPTKRRGIRAETDEI